MSDDAGGFMVCMLIFLVAGMGLVGPTACREGKHRIRVEAVEHGHGEWVTDKEGNSTFRWVEQHESEAK